MEKIYYLAPWTFIDSVAMWQEYFLPSQSGQVLMRMGGQVDACGQIMDKIAKIETILNRNNGFVDKIATLHTIVQELLEFRCER